MSRFPTPGQDDDVWGEYLAPIHTTTGTNARPFTLGQVFFLPVDVAVQTFYSGLGTSISAAGNIGTATGVTIHVGLYNDIGTGQEPTGTPTIVTTTTPGGFNTEVDISVTNSTANDQVVSWSTAQELNPGRYWIGWELTANGALTTDPTMVAIYPIQQIGTASLGNTGDRGAWSQQARANDAALPTIATLTRTNIVTPMIGMKLY